MGVKRMVMIDDDDDKAVKLVLIEDDGDVR